MERRDLRDHVALVTGGNHGIGAAAAEALAARGARVLISYLRLTDAVDPGIPDEYRRNRAGDAEQVLAAIREQGGRAVAVEADLADGTTPARVFDVAESELGPIDILINNASGWLADTFVPATPDRLGRHSTRVTIDTFDRQFAVDTRGSAALIAEFARRHAARHATWGRIIGLTSGGPDGFPGEVSYGAAKAALENYTMSAAFELASLGITANIVHPPVTDTGWITENVRRHLADRPDMIHIAQPQEVAAIIAFLASDEARVDHGKRHSTTLTMARIRSGAALRSGASPRRCLQAALSAAFILLAVADAAVAEVVRIEVQRRDDWGTHERIIGRVYLAIDPMVPANRAIADIDHAPRNASGKVEFSSDLLFFRPKDARRARGTVFLEVVNRGRDQSLAIVSGAQQRNLSPESWNLGDGFLLEQGFAVAFLGWQFDVRPLQGLTFTAPIASVESLVRDAHIELAHPGGVEVPLTYCVAESGRDSAALTFRTRMDETPQPIPRDGWQLAVNGCSMRVTSARGTGIYEAVYRASGSPVAGLGLAAIRDFASYLKYAGDGATLRESPAALQRVIGYGYSQSGRLLREFVRDGFNADERGRAAFDGLMISSAGAGGGSFNHRFAMPGQAGNSVLSVLRPVDLPPFTDDGLLAKASSARVTPKIFYTFSSTEYWARAGSLTHTNDEGRADAALAPTSRLYFLAGTPHSMGGLPLSRGRDQYRQFVNFAEQRWVTRALLVELDAWTRRDREPPSSQYPAIARGELVPLEDVRFPKVPAFPFATYMPRVWRMDYGREYSTTRVITIEPPQTGEPYRVLVPQVNNDGNDVAGVRMPEVAVPLGTYTGWNVTVPQLTDLRYLGGLVGGFEPFARTREQRVANGDSRLSIAERYSGRQDYLDRIRRAATDLVRQRFLRVEDVPAVLQSAERMWNAVVPGDPLP